MTDFAQMTPEQFEYWMVNVRPVLVRLQEQQQARARRWAWEMIGRPVRRRPESPEEASRGRT